MLTKFTTCAVIAVSAAAQYNQEYNQSYGYNAYQAPVASAEIARPTYESFFGSEKPADVLKPAYVEEFEGIARPTYTGNVPARPTGPSGPSTLAGPSEHGYVYGGQAYAGYGGYGSDNYGWGGYGEQQ